MVQQGSVRGDEGGTGPLRRGGVASRSAGSQVSRPRSPRLHDRARIPLLQVNSIAFSVFDDIFVVGLEIGEARCAGMCV